MVLINGTKFACDTCIKGHRTSSCKHTDRLLVEIKKKGRPQTQCEHCRELRKTKQMHVKCLCAPSKGGAPTVPSPDGSPNLESPQSTSPVIPACGQGPECPCCVPRKRPSTSKKNKIASSHYMGELELASSLSRSAPSSTDAGPEASLISITPMLPNHLTTDAGHAHHAHASSFSPYETAYTVHLQHHRRGKSDTTAASCCASYSLPAAEFDPSPSEGLFGAFPTELLPQADKPSVMDDPTLDLSILDQNDFMDLFNNISSSQTSQSSPTRESPSRDISAFFESLSGASTLPDVALNDTDPGIFDSFNPTFGLDPTWILSEDPSWLATPTFVHTET
ncbi:copper fist DNA binding domain-containing protein [Flagelloscypha sp. PMI_526]|nr:copper fist DNA binding domain-containing protein [Flagelloscypha sp. PMI_526]